MMPHQPGADTPASALVYSYWAGAGTTTARTASSPTTSRESALARRVWPAIAASSPGVPWARAAREGVGQFLDLGCGYPLGTGIHDIARAVNPAATVAYVDADQDLADYSSWVLTEDQKLEGVTAVMGDLRDPAAVLEYPSVWQVVDPGRPACVIAAMVLHFMPRARPRR
jgi:hypothetical protein